MSAPRRMKANPTGNTMRHSVEHDWSAGCNVDPKCIPVIDLDTLAERVAAIEAEMPRIAALENEGQKFLKLECQNANAIGDLQSRLGEYMEKVDKLETPKPAEPEQVIVVMAPNDNPQHCAFTHSVTSCGHRERHPYGPHCDTHGCIPLSEFNRRKEAEKAKMEAKMEPEPGDMVRVENKGEQSSSRSEFRVVAVTEWMIDKQGYAYQSNACQVVSRPPFVSGEQVTRRSDGRPGIVTMSNGKLLVMTDYRFPYKYDQQATNDLWKRDSWHPELHKEK